MAGHEATTTGRSNRSAPTNGATGGPKPKPKATRRSRIVGEPTATTPTVTEGGSSISGERVDLRSGAVGRVEASELSVALGAVGAARAEHVSVDRGALGAALADRVEVSRGYARSILARNVQLDRAAARVVIAADVTAQRTAVMFLIARRVSGDVRVLFDWRGAIAFGATAGLIAGLVARARRSR